MKLRTFVPLAAAGLPLLLLACGEVTIEPGSGGAGGGGDPCAPFVSEAPTPQPVTLRLVNATEAPIYLGEETPSCSVAVGFTLEDDGGAPLKASQGSCEPTCSELTQYTCGCPADCALPVVTMIAPGGIYEIGWPGLVFEAATMPAECFADPACAGSSCLIASEPPPPPLVFRSAAWTGVDCGGAPTCSGDPDRAGTCISGDGRPTGAGAKRAARATWTGAGPLDLVFQ